MAVVNELIQERVREVVGALARQGPIRAAYLFGSQVAGTPDQFSDFDIAAFVEEFGRWDLRRRTRTAVEVQTQFGDDIELHFLPAEFLDNPPPASFAAYVLSHGVLIELGDTESTESTAHRKI